MSHWPTQTLVKCQDWPTQTLVKCQDWLTSNTPSQTHTRQHTNNRAWGSMVLTVAVFCYRAPEWAGISSLLAPAADGRHQSAGYSSPGGSGLDSWERWWYYYSTSVKRQTGLTTIHLHTRFDLSASKLTSDTVTKVLSWMFPITGLLRYMDAARNILYSTWINNSQLW